MNETLQVRVSTLLLQIARGEIIPILTGANSVGRSYTDWEDTWCDTPTFQCSSWKIRIFNDCGEWNYVDGGVTPEGETFEYEDVNECGAEPDEQDHYFPEGALSREDRDSMLAAFYQAVPKEENVTDETKEPQQPTPALPERPVPGPDDKVMRVWRDSDGRVWVDDDDMGVANAFNLVHWAHMICQAPFTGRQIAAEIAQTGFIMGRMVHEHEIRMHGATGPGSNLVSPRGEKLPLSGNPLGNPESEDRVKRYSESKHRGESEETAGPPPGTGPAGDTLQSSPKRK